MPSGFFGFRVSLLLVNVTFSPAPSCCQRNRPPDNSHLGQLRNRGSDLLVGRDLIGHLAVVVFLVSDQVKVSGACQAKDDCLLFAGFFALKSFIDRNTDGMGTLGGGKNALDAGKLLRGFENTALVDADSLHEAVVGRPHGWGRG